MHGYLGIVLTSGAAGGGERRLAARNVLERWCVLLVGIVAVVFLSDGTLKVLPC